MPIDSKRKGDRIERQVVNLLTQSGIRAAKISRCGYAGPDLWIAPPAGGKAGLSVEVKARKEPIATLDNWLKDQSDLVILRPDRVEPQVFMPWRTFIKLMEAFQGQPVFVDARRVDDSIEEHTLDGMSDDESV